MSDSFSDAYRPDSKPKGFGWWPLQEQKNYCMKLWTRGDRDIWLIDKLYHFEVLTQLQAVTAYNTHHPEWVKANGH